MYPERKKSKHKFASVIAESENETLTLTLTVTCNQRFVNFVLVIGKKAKNANKSLAISLCFLYAIYSLMLSLNEYQKSKIGGIKIFSTSAQVY